MSNDNYTMSFNVGISEGEKDIAYALQASCPGSNPGVRTSLFHQLSAGVAKHGQRRRT